MRYIIIILLCLTSLSSLHAERADLDSLDYYLALRHDYDLRKENRIQSLKESIASIDNDLDRQYDLYNSLYAEYRSYIYDSAYMCVTKLKEISLQLNDPDKIISSQTKEGVCYLFSGLFKESFDILTTLRVTDDCSDETKIDYYASKSRLYYDLADYNNNDEFRLRYEEIGNQIIDSALILLPLNSPRFWTTIALKRMKSDNNRGALDAFHKMIDTNDYTEHELAIATSSIAYLLTLQGKKEEAKRYWIQAAISDIKYSTKETVALRNLAQLLYEEGDVMRAAEYIKVAMTDASFYNARHRQLEVVYILPIIEGSRISIIENQKDRITLISYFLLLLILLLIVAFYIIWTQLKRISQARRTIQATIEELQQSNRMLSEANKIKEEYIGFFFSQNSEFIDKLESFQKWVGRKVTTRQFDDLKSIPKGYDVRKDRESMYSNFDQVFLKLFPAFVEQFNALLREEEQIILKKNELLNPDLRIYALIRLGINDNEKIAQFLGYSVNTIYTYKTKIKNKAKDSNETFKQKVMEIRSV
ncbi:DUF6377 domain-containing protein [Parabacteroides sp. OttesenSCG-928-N08]|nr:DUF6377 domain-containing protein [Parabacteroides sp. OttesenSCG-928-N08]